MIGIIAFWDALTSVQLTPMLLTSRQIKNAIDEFTSDLRDRIERVEITQIALPSRLEAEHRLRTLSPNVAVAAQTAMHLGVAML
jgi:hypothetical protein